MGVTHVEEYLEAGALVVALGGSWVALGRSGMSRWQRELAAWRRSREAGRAAVIASEEREAFDPLRITGAVSQMLQAAERSWDPDKLGISGQALDASLAAWASAHFHGRASRLHGAPKIGLLRVVSRQDLSEDRAVLRVRFAIKYEHKADARESRIGRYDERWTLAHRGAVWRLVEFDAEPLADQLLRARSIAADWDDDERLTQQSLEEIARASPTTPGVAALSDPDSAPDKRLLDLSVIDDRFTPALIDKTLELLVETWEESMTGSRRSLRQHATAHAADELLAPETVWSPCRLIIRDAELTSKKIVSLHADDPARLKVDVTVTALRYLAGESGTAVAGSFEVHHDIPMRWTLQLTDKQCAWQLVDSSNPARLIAGAILGSAEPEDGRAHQAAIRSIRRLIGR